MKTGYEGDLNPRVNSNWLLYMIISFKSRYLPKSEHLQLIQLYNCFCTSSCIKASLSSFLCWARKSSSRLNAPCQRLLFSHISPHTPNVTSFCREKKKMSSHTCWWIVFVQGNNNTCLYTSEARFQNSSSLTWMVVNEESFSQKQQRSLWPSSSNHRQTKK